MGDKKNKTLGKNSNCFFYVEENAIIVSSLWLLHDSFSPPACSASALTLPTFQWLLERGLGCRGIGCEAQLFKAEWPLHGFSPCLQFQHPPQASNNYLHLQLQGIHPLIWPLHSSACSHTQMYASIKK